MKFLEGTPLHVVVDARTTPISVLHREGTGSLDEEQFASKQEAAEFTLQDARTHDRFAGLTLGGSIGMAFFTAFNFLNEHTDSPLQEKPFIIPALLTIALLGVANAFDRKASLNHKLHLAVNEAIIRNKDYHETTFRPK